MLLSIRREEYALLIYRLALAYVFYFIARALFFAYNTHLIHIDSFFTFLNICFHGLAFDTSILLLLNAPFILLSMAPLFINTDRRYQKGLFYLYFVVNFIAYAFNFMDFIYYPYQFGRSTVGIADSIVHEANAGLLIWNFIIDYWHVFLLFFICCWSWRYLYRRYKANPFVIILNRRKYIGSSIVILAAAALIGALGIRGKLSGSPLSMRDAGRYAHSSAQADMMLNTPFTLMETLLKSDFHKMNFFNQATVDSLVRPTKEYRNHPSSRPNIVLLILESNAREYSGAFNRNRGIPDFESYTPFIDSLAKHSLIFTNAYANGSKSIHAIPSILAGVPSFRDAFISSKYADQPTESLVSILKNLGYSSSFFHGASDGTMGFMKYVKELGIDAYYGREEYNNEADFDGVWGIWDEPFFMYFNKEISRQKQPFFATLFSVTSHEPYHVPAKYERKFPKGKLQIHQCIGYTDYALKKFFEQAKKEPWFRNTLFIITGDHGNMIAYKEYEKEMNRNSVVMMIYDPQERYVGENDDFAQHIDLYPTILDLIGYQKPFRSWGRSLMGDTTTTPFVIRYSSHNYQMMRGNYICIFDGKKATGFYDKDDKDLEHNLIDHRNAEMDLVEKECKAFLQEYMRAIIDRKLREHP